MDQLLSLVRFQVIVVLIMFIMAFASSFYMLNVDSQKVTREPVPLAVLYLLRMMANLFLPTWKLLGDMSLAQIFDRSAKCPITSVRLHIRLAYQLCVDEGNGRREREDS